METRAFRIKLKPNSVDRVRAWAEEIMRRKEEALETLQDEGVLLECFFLDRGDDGDYLISIMTAEDFERSHAVARDSTHGIDAFHRAFKRDTWESVDALEGLVELTSPDMTSSR
jgi:fructose 1,6-bisphosphatase